MDDARLCTSCNHVLSKLMILPCSSRFCLSAYDTRIGSAYIIMEKVDGVTLKERPASNPTAKDYRPLLECILKVESRCFKVVFSLFGDLYYKEDVSPELQMIGLYADLITRPPLGGQPALPMTKPRVPRMDGASRRARRPPSVGV